METGFARSMFGQQTVLFTLTLVVTAIWFATFNVVSERFHTIVVLMVNAGLAALMVTCSGLLRAHQKRTAPNLLELFFGVCFAAFLFVLISSGVPAVFGG